MRWAFVVSCVVALTSVSVGAQQATEATESADVRLEWIAPSECIGERELAKLVEANRSDEPLSASRRVAGRAEKSQNGYRFSLDLWEENRRIGQRVLDVNGENCRVEDASLALVVAMLLEGPELQRERPTAIVSSTLVRFDVPPTSSPESSFSLATAVALMPGLTPSVVPGPLLGFAFSRERLVARLEASYLPRSSTSRPGLGSVSLDAASIGLFGCGVLVPAPVEFEVCGGARGALVHASGAEFPRNRDASSSLGVLAALARVAYPLTRRVDVFARAGLEVATNRVTLVGVDDDGRERVLFETARVFPNLVMGFELTL